jgi:hypothetical protein
MSERWAEVRESMVKAIMLRRSCDRAEAEIIMHRIADRLGGHTHEEVKAMHPLARASSVSTEEGK